MESSELVVLSSMSSLSLSFLIIVLLIIFKRKVCATAKVPLLCSSTTGTGGRGLPTTWTPANATYYESFAKCCKGTPIYDPKAPKDECKKYSACKYLGQFSGLDGKLTYDQVKARNIVSVFYSPQQKNQGKDLQWWKANVKGKTIEVRSGSKVMKMEALDTCGEWDCNLCCSKNAHASSGWLLDIEVNTAKRFWGGKAKNGDVEFRVV
jgi:hypothetical protein